MADMALIMHKTSRTKAVQRIQHVHTDVEATCINGGFCTHAPPLIWQLFGTDKTKEQAFGPYQRLAGKPSQLASNSRTAALFGHCPAPQLRWAQYAWHRSVCGHGCRGVTRTVGGTCRTTCTLAKTGLVGKAPEHPLPSTAWSFHASLSETIVQALPFRSAGRG